MGITPLASAIVDKVDVSLDGPGGVNVYSFTNQGVPFSTPANSAADGSYTLTVTETGVLAPTDPTQATTTRTFTVVGGGGPPTPTVLSGPAGVVGPAGPFVFSWSLTAGAVSAHWQLFDLTTLLSEGDVPAPAVSVALTPTLSPGDRTLNFRVLLKDGLANFSLPASWQPFIVDQTPPGAPTGVTGPVGASRSLTPSFAWQGTEVGGSFEWDITDRASGQSIFLPAGAHVATTTTITAPRLPLAPNVVHRLLFHLRQLDPYGNRGPESTIPFTITTVQAIVKPRTRLARLMKPAMGHTVSTLRPMLRWRRTNPGTVLFNVQIYAGNRKVLTAFPTGTSLRVPKGRLKRGTQYTWHVWSYIGKAKNYARLPITSYFFTKR